jgi:isoquinoline 1-oxidoreductase subunit alpha
MTIHFTINNKPMSFDGDLDMPLLWYLRDHAKLTGTKYGCGIAECGACTVHIDGRAVRSCVIPLKNVEGKNIETIEGLAQGKELHAVQQAWIEEDVSQCGYCQSGQLMAAADLLSRNKDPDNKDIAEITNICRCGTYPRIRKAIKRAAQIIKEEKL